jgi:hypothetical protein
MGASKCFKSYFLTRLNNEMLEWGKININYNDIKIT